MVGRGLTILGPRAVTTRNPAVFLGALDSTGTIAIGKRADLVLLRANPLENVLHTQQVVGTMLGGWWLPREELDARLAAAKVPGPLYGR